MHYRILVVIPANAQPAFFVPQYKLELQSHRWFEFFGFDPDSPYLHPRAFPTKELAAKFLFDGPQIWNPGQYSGFLVRDVTDETFIDLQPKTLPNSRT